MIIENNYVYKKLINPSYIRKDALLLAIESIKLLQDYENIKTLRKEKYQLLELGKERILELNKNLSRLKEKIPKAKLEKERPKLAAKYIKKKEIKHIGHKPIVSSLDMELDTIKHKLDSLKI